MFISRQEIIDKINQFSAQKKPFLFTVDFNGEKGFVYSPEEALNAGIKYELCSGKKDQKKNQKPSFFFSFREVAFETYKLAFKRIIFHLERGDTYLINLTFPTPIITNLTLEEIYETSVAPYKLMVPGCFVVFSPELFVRISDSKIFSHPMKGTIDATIPGAAQKLLEDEKELFEHNTIVDLIRNDLSMVATGVQVERFRYLDCIQTNRGDLLQMSSAITGNLPAGYMERLGEILFTLLPAGSVTGAPKEKTVEIIRQCESYQRDFYTGIFGFFDGESLTSAVSIRFIEQGTDGLLYKSGGGITALSNVESEYGEMLKKIYIPIV